MLKLWVPLGRLDTGYKMGRGLLKKKRRFPPWKANHFAVFVWFSSGSEPLPRISQWKIKKYTNLSFLVGSFLVGLFLKTWSLLVGFIFSIRQLLLSLLPLFASVWVGSLKTDVWNLAQDVSRWRDENKEKHAKTNQLQILKKPWRYDDF